MEGEKEYKSAIRIAKSPKAVYYGNLGVLYHRCLKCQLFQQWRHQYLPVNLIQSNVSIFGIFFCLYICFSVFFFIDFVFFSSFFSFPAVSREGWRLPELQYSTAFAAHINS